MSEQTGVALMRDRSSDTSGGQTHMQHLGNCHDNLLSMIPLKLVDNL